MLDKLIEIYGRQTIDKVEADPEYVAICKANDGTPFFHNERYRVERIKRQLEDKVEIQQTRQKQAKHALRLFQRLLGSKESEDEIGLRLTKAAYYVHWTPLQQEYFDSAVTRLRNGQDYFLSFTQRNLNGAGNPINSMHRYLIQSYGIPDPKDNSKNELARMVHSALRTSKYAFRGFFFPEHEDDSAQVDHKLKSALERSLVFIQIVQNEMFNRQYPGDKNYCYTEYREAVSRKKEMIYLFANGEHPEDLILEDDAEITLDEWYQYVRGVDCISLAPTYLADQSHNLEENRAKLKERLVEKLHGYREAIWEGVPTDLT